MTDTIVFNFDGGAKDILLVYEDRVVIQHKGVINALAMGMKGDKTLYYYDITAVEFKRPGAITQGYIQFTLPGGNESRRGVIAASVDENSITIIGKKRIPEAEDVVQYINNRIKEFKSGKNPVAAPASSADELLKFKQLLDSGAITQEEFDAKKKQLLGL